MQRLCRFPLVSIALLFTIVAAPGHAAQPETQQAKPGVVSGMVTTAAGVGIAGVEVQIAGTNKAGGYSKFKVTTDAAGAYSLPVPDGVYDVEARLTRKLGEFHYLSELAPAGASDDFDSAHGAIRNLVWRINGVRPGGDASPAEHRSYFGGSIQLQQGDPNSHDNPPFKLAAGAKIEITLTPAGPLLDGSEGKTLTHSFAFDKEIRFTHYSKRQWLDIPIGTYTATATLTEAGGAPKPLRIAMQYYNGPEVALAASTTVVFPTSDTGSGLTPYTNVASVHVSP